MARTTKNKEELYIRQDIGSGRPIVLLHGMFGDGTQWRVIADLLSDYFRVIVVDLLGHGKSPRPEGAQYTPTEHSQALRQTLQRLDATENLTIVGYSMGGTVALQYAADYHDVGQLYMISTPFYLKPDEMLEAGYANSLLYTKLSLAFFRWVDKALKKDKLLYKIVEKDNLMKILHTLVDAYDNNLDPEVTRLNLKNLINEFKFIEALQKVEAPTTYYSGRRDVFVVHGQLIALKKVLPLMEIETLGIVKNDHMLVQYLPQQMVEVLTRHREEQLHIASDAGTGDVFVLLHGIESSSRYWKVVAKALSAKHRVITIDLLGFGNSPKPHNVAYSLDDHVQWLHRTLAAYGITSFTLMGHSLGSLVAMAYTAQYPKEVKDLYLVAPVFVNDGVKRKRFFIRKFNYIDYFSDTGYLVSTIVKTVGQKRIDKFVPTIRSISNAIKNQDSLRLAKKLGSHKTTIIYGDDDQLVDEYQLESVAGVLKKPKLVAVPSGTHNFALYEPNTVLQAVDPTITPVQTRKVRAKKDRAVRELLTLAIPILSIKSLFYIITGLLLFSPFKEETIVAGVSILVMTQSFQMIRGSFSLKNEGLSYFGYFSLGMFGIVLGFILTNFFNFSLWIALLLVCGYIMLNGISRIAAGVLWTTDRRLRRKQLLSGFALFLVSLSAFFGSLVSVHLIVYCIAGYLLLRGLAIGFYALISLSAALVRSY